MLMCFRLFVGAELHRVKATLNQCVMEGAEREAELTSQVNELAEIIRVSRESDAAISSHISSSEKADRSDALQSRVEELEKIIGALRNSLRTLDIDHEEEVIGHIICLFLSVTENISV